MKSLSCTYPWALAGGAGALRRVRALLWSTTPGLYGQTGRQSA